MGGIDEVVWVQLATRIPQSLRRELKFALRDRPHLHDGLRDEGARAGARALQWRSRQSVE